MANALPAPTQARGKAIPAPTQTLELPDTLATSLRKIDGGAVGWLSVPSAGAGLSSMIEEFAGAGVFAKMGTAAAAITVTVGTQGPGNRQVVLEIVRPGLGRWGSDRPEYQATQGQQASLAEPAVVNWLALEIDTIRGSALTAYLPLLVVIGADCLPDDIDATLTERLEQLATEQRCVVALIREREGHGAVQWSTL